MSYLIEKDGERQYVGSLDGYEGWEVLGEGEAAQPPDDNDAIFQDGTWIIPLDVLKRRKWEDIKACRDMARFLGCPTEFGLIDADPESQRKVSGGVNMAMLLGEVFSVSWTMYDNSVVTLNAAQMNAIGIAVGMFEAQLHGTGQALRAQIDAATTAEEVEAVEWPFSPA